MVLTGIIVTIEEGTETATTTVMEMKYSGALNKGRLQ